MLSDRGPGERSELETLFDNLFDAAVVIDAASGRFIGVNQQAMQLLGYPEAELHEMTPSDIHPHEIPHLANFLDSVRRHGRWMSNDLSCRTKSGDTVPAEIRATRFVNGDRELIVLIIRDRRIDQFADLGRSMRQVAHDLRNTLATAQLLSDNLVTHTDRTVSRNAETITRAIERALHMCRRTLDAGRSELPPPRHQRFLLIDLVEEVRSALGADGEEVRLDCPEPDADTIVDADFDQIYRILLNLGRNAFDAGARVVSIACRQAGDDLAIEIADDGPGLPPIVVEHLFEDKPRCANPAKTGLGLMIARHLARNHNGDLRLIKSDSQGTVFQLVLPARPSL